MLSDVITGQTKHMVLAGSIRLSLTTGTPVKLPLLTVSVNLIDSKGLNHRDVICHKNTTGS